MINKISFNEPKINIPAQVMFLYKIFEVYNFDLLICGEYLRNILLQIPETGSVTVASNMETREAALLLSNNKNIKIISRNPLTRSFLMNVSTPEGQLNISYTKIIAPDKLFKLHSLQQEHDSQPPSSNTSDLRYIVNNFSVNSIFYSIKTQSLLDPFNGISDLNNKLLRIIGDADKAFKYNPALIMDVPLISSQLDFNIDSACLAAARANCNLLKYLDKELLCEKFEQTILSEYRINNRRFNQTEYALTILNALNIYPYILNGYIPKKESFKICAKAKPDLALRLAVLIDNVKSAKNAFLHNDIFLYKQILKKIYNYTQAKKILKLDFADIPFNIAKYHFNSALEIAKLYNPDLFEYLTKIKQSGAFYAYSSIPLTSKEIADASGLEEDHLTLAKRKLIEYSILNPEKLSKQDLITYLQNTFKSN